MHQSLVITEDEIAYEEWQTEETLVKLSKRMPDRYQRMDNGGWCSPPGIEAAAKLGLKYKIRTDKEVNPIVTDNTLFLANYLRPRKGWRTVPATANEWLKRFGVDKALAASAIETVKSEQGITLEDLRKKLDAGIKKTPENIGKTADLLNSLVIVGKLYVNLEKERLADPESAHVFTSREVAAAYAILPVRTKAWYPDMTPRAVTLEPGEQILVNETAWTVISTNSRITTLFSEAKKTWKVENAVLDEMIKSGEVTSPHARAVRTLDPIARQRLDSAGPEDVKRATYRFNMIAYRIMPGVSPPAHLPPERTLRSWEQKYRYAELEYGFGYIGLLDNTKAKGNRTSRYTSDAINLAESYVVSEWETYTQPTLQLVYDLYVQACIEKGILRPVSYNKMRDMVLKRPIYESLTARKGSKGSYPKEPFYWTLKFTTPRHGSMPMAIGHLDHTRVDVSPRSSMDGSSMPPVWLTLLTCTFSRRILALYMSFEAPSYISCMMVLRECMRRHGRLPDTVVCDKGPEFQSVYFASMLAEQGCTLMTRPSKPRYGSVIERIFGTMNRQFFWNLKGNTRLMRNPRAVGKSANPKRHAVWTLPALFAATCQFSYEVYDTRIHKTLGESPRDAFFSGLDRSGRRETAQRAYDEAFIRSSCPTTRKGTAKVQESGVQINYLYYWHDLFRSCIGEIVPVKFDPHDMGHAYAYVRGEWRECDVQRREFVGKSGMQVKLAAQMLADANELRGLSKTITDKSLAEFFVQIRHNEKLLAQQFKDLELAPVLEVIKGTRSYHSLYPTANALQPVLSVVGAQAEPGAEDGAKAIPIEPGRARTSSPHLQGVSRESVVQPGVGPMNESIDIDENDEDDDDDYIEPMKTRTKL